MKSLNTLSAAINFRHLRYFVAVVEEGGIRAAASRLHVSQPPLTRQIHQLEKAMGVELLVRTAHGVIPNNVGQDFYTEARNILDLTLRAARHARLVNKGLAGRIDIGVFGSPIFEMIPRLISRFHKDNERVDISVHTMNKSEQLRALKEHRIDVGFNRFMTNEPGLKWDVVEQQNLEVAINLHNPLSRSNKLSLADVASERIILYPRSRRSGYLDHVLEAFYAHGLTPDTCTIVDDMPTAIAMVSSNIGVSVVPHSASSIHLDSIKYVSLTKKDHISVESCMVYRDEQHSAVLQNFIDMARSYRNW